MKCPYNFAKIGSWNIHGAYYLVNNFKVNKLESEIFLKTLALHDILCLQETHCGPRDEIACHINDFHAIPHSRKRSSNNRFYGGMMLLVRKSIRKGVKVMYTEDPDILGIILNKDFFGLKQDYTVWFTYAPPSSSSYSVTREKVLCSLEKFLVTDNNGCSFILGDLNGRTTQNPDFIADDNDHHSPISVIADYRHDTPIPRNNMDRSPVDKQGKEILEICKNLNFRILNGRTHGDRWGALTRYPIAANDNPSLLDYALCSLDIISLVRSFRVHPITDISDH